MTRRTHPCIACFDYEGTSKFSLKNRRTRHKNRICAPCRRRGVRVDQGQLIVPLTVKYQGRAA